MVPARLIALPHLPLTVNGKLDLRALPDPERAPGTGNGAGNGAAVARAPRSEMERHLLEIWRDLLGDGMLGPDDNVFDHGAHSVLVVQARNRMQELLKRQIPVVLLFQYPRVSALAEQFTDSGAAADPNPDAAARQRAVRRRDAERRHAARQRGP
jgi:hypothetical protein